VVGFRCLPPALDRRSLPRELGRTTCEERRAPRTPPSHRPPAQPRRSRSRAALCVLWCRERDPEDLRHFFSTSMITSAWRRRSCRALFSRSSCVTFFVNGFFGRGLRPRLRGPRPRSEPSRRCLRHADRWDEYKPSRRRSSPILPGSVQASACSRMRSLYSAVKRRRRAFSGTSGSATTSTGPPAGAAAPGPGSPPEPGLSLRSRPGASVAPGTGADVRFVCWDMFPLPSALYTNIGMLPCLIHLGREGGLTLRAWSAR